MFLTNLSLKRPVFATVTILALVVLGIVSYAGLKINDFPDVEFPYVAVTVILPGASPEQVESEIGQKLEEAFGQIAGVKHIHTSAREGICITFGEFTLETDPDVAAQNVRDKVGAIRGRLPQDSEEPVISKFDPMAVPIFSLAVTGDLTMRELSKIVDDSIKSRLETINGVGALNLYGAEKREIQIQLDKGKLAAFGLAIPEVLGSLRSENLDIPGGKVSKDGLEMTLRTVGKVNSVEEFSSLPVARREGVQLFVRDIGTVADGARDQDSYSRYQGRPAIGIDVVKQSGVNTVALADQILKTVDGIKRELPPGVFLDVVKDNSTDIRNGVNDVQKTILEGAFLAVVMVFIFLRDWRSTLISALSIPTSIIATFFAMNLLGYTINYMTLMALSLSVGLLIDDSIVVIENIVRHLRMGQNPIQAAREATAELGLAVTATTLTVVAVFLPVGMMSGIVGQYFKQFGITVVCSVLVSLLVSFTLVPLLASRHLKTGDYVPGGPLGKFLAWFNRVFDQITTEYSNFLKVVLNNRLKTLGVAVALFIGSLALIPYLGSSFLPSADLGEINITAEFDAGLSLDAAGKMTEKLEGIIQSYPEVLKIYSTVRAGGASIYVKVPEKGQRQSPIDKTSGELRRKMNSLPGVKVVVSYQSEMVGGPAVQYLVLGEDFTELQKYAAKAQKIMESTPGAVDVGLSYKPGKPEARVEVKRDLAADLGVSTAQISQTLATLFNGTVVSQYEEKGDRHDVRVRLVDTQRRQLADLGNIYLPGMIPLSQVTETVFSGAPNEISRYDRTREITLSANLENTSLGEFEKEFMKRVEQELEMPEGYRIYAGGQSEFMGDTFNTMFLALFAGIFFIFFILAAQFESYIDPFSIMLSIPLAVVGAILGLLVTGSDLSIMSMIGMIMLMGLVTKNAILLIDFTKKQRARGVERDEALGNAARIRLRPIVMTSLAMIFGMTPLALGLGSGAESRAPMAHAVIGGLITSTLLTLVVVPVVYSCLDDLKKKTASLFGSR